MKKKGISAVVATVLIILITVAAVAIIWAGVLPIVDRLKSGTVCIDAMGVQLLEGYTCVSSDGHNGSIQVGHGAKSFNLADLQVLISAGGDTTVFTITNYTSTLVPTSESVPLPGVNEEKVYVINTSAITGTIEQVQIAPIISVGNTEETCEVSATRVLRVC